MHTKNYQVKGFGEVSVTHNSDWSGIATVFWREKGKMKNVSLPGRLLVSMGRKSAKDALWADLIEFIEGVEG